MMIIVVFFILLASTILLNAEFTDEGAMSRRKKKSTPTAKPTISKRPTSKSTKKPKYTKAPPILPSSHKPSTYRSMKPTTKPSTQPSARSTSQPSARSTSQPTSLNPISNPTKVSPTLTPTVIPTLTLSGCPSSLTPTTSRPVSTFPSINSQSLLPINCPSIGSTMLSMNPSTALTASVCPKILMASYFYPMLWQANDPWNFGLQEIAGGLAILNPSSGFFTTVDPYQATALLNAQMAGVKMLGYVSTSFGSRSEAAVKANIDTYLALYESVDGFFLDELATSINFLHHYTNITQYIRQQAVVRNRKFSIVLNPGVFPAEGFMDIADIVVVFEDYYANYINSYISPSYQSSYPSSKFAHIIHDASTTLEMQMALSLAKQRNAGYVYVTNVTYSEVPPYIYQEAGLISSCNLVHSSYLTNAYSWLRSQQHSPSGLLQSYENFLVDNAYAYDQAVAAIALLLESQTITSPNFIAAQKIVTFLFTSLTNHNQGKSAWAVPLYWSLSSSTPHGTEYSGNAAWVAEAFGLYWLLTGDNRFSTAVINISNWLVAHISSTNGCLKGTDTVTWCSTEHNIDAYFALHLANYLTKSTVFLTASNTIGSSLLTTLWNTNQKRFQTGLNDPSFALDVQSWGSIWLISGRYATLEVSQSRSQSALQFADTFFLNSQTSALLSNENQPQQSTGYGPYADSSNSFHANTVWSEGSFGVALAYLRLGNIDKAKTIVQGILPSMVTSSGGVLYAANRTIVDVSGDEFYPYASVAGTAWLAIVASANQYLLWNGDITSDHLSERDFG